MVSNVNADLWEEVVEDAEAMATEYREEGWDVVCIRPADVSPAEKPDRFGMSVLLPGSDYDAVEAVIEQPDVDFDGAEVFTHISGPTVYAMAVERDETTQTAVVIPMVYSMSELDRIFEAALDSGRLELHLRPLSIETWVTFAHDDPTLFFDPDTLEKIIENDPQRQAADQLGAALDDGTSDAAASTLEDLGEGG